MFPDARGSVSRKTCSISCAAEMKAAWRRDNPVLGPSLPVVKEPPAPHVCPWCDSEFEKGPDHRGGRYCCESHYNYGSSRVKGVTNLRYFSCDGCNRTVVQAAHWHAATTCTRCTKKRRRSRDKAVRRGATATESFTLRVIAERDNWRCHLCGRKVPDRPYAYRNTDPTLDHLVPVSAGGEHVMSNVKLAHMICNAKRNTGGTVQLLLVG